MNDIITILTSEDRDEIKTELKKLIIERVDTDLKDYNMYCFNPEYIENVVGDMFNEIVEELQPKFKKAIKDKMTALIDTMQLPKDYK